MSKYIPRTLNIKDKIDNLFELAEELLTIEYKYDEDEEGLVENRCDSNSSEEDDDEEGKYVDLFYPAIFVLSVANKANILFKALIEVDSDDEELHQKLYDEMYPIVAEAEYKYLSDRFDSWTSYTDPEGYDASMYMIGNRAYKIGNDKDGFIMEWRDIDKQNVRDSLYEELGEAGKLMRIHGDL